MKLHFKLFWIVLFMQTAVAFSQNKSAFDPLPEIKIYVGMPITFGNNFLNESHNANYSFGFTTSPFSVYKFRIGFGFNYSYFDITDKETAGNIKNSHFYAYYGYLGYPLQIKERFEVEAKLGIGGSSLQQKSGSQDFGSMDGGLLVAGLNLEYEFAYPFEIFAGFDYLYSGFNVKSPNEYQSFFKNAHQINWMAGIKFNLRKRKNKDAEL